VTKLQKAIYRKAAKLAKKKNIPYLFFDTAILRSDKDIKIVGITKVVSYIVNSSLCRTVSSRMLEHQHLFKQIGDFK